MNLFINSPSFYTQFFGVIDGVYSMCNEISRNIDVSRYTSSIDTIGITPIIAPNDEKAQGRWEDYIKVSTKYRMASISLSSDYDAFCTATLDQKQQIVLENILRSMYVVKERLKNKFDYDHIKTDILLIAKDFLM